MLRLALGWSEGSSSGLLGILDNLDSPPQYQQGDRQSHKQIGQAGLQELYQYPRADYPNVGNNIIPGKKSSWPACELLHGDDGQ